MYISECVRHRSVSCSSVLHGVMFFLLMPLLLELNHAWFLHSVFCFVQVSSISDWIPTCIVFATSTKVRAPVRLRSAPIRRSCNRSRPGKPQITCSGSSRRNSGDSSSIVSSLKQLLGFSKWFMQGAEPVVPLSLEEDGRSAEHCCRTPRRQKASTAQRIAEYAELSGKD
ncbi:putative transmembrane protein [Toxoplasma gondii GT1]|uniref:Putative transmembrane protein n=2 Tax=Toxoplasma gondii TaxID=5811 RepID=S7WAX8_TOXGG|nr:putative transmembrane protein [Toxoplasma gondii GT1]KFH09022.1 putative transmembrane protein [Toxoplasma gondii MAS]